MLPTCAVKFTDMKALTRFVCTRTLCELLSLDLEYPSLIFVHAYVGWKNKKKRGELAYEERRSDYIHGVHSCAHIEGKHPRGRPQPRLRAHTALFPFPTYEEEKGGEGPCVRARGQRKRERRT